MTLILELPPSAEQAVAEAAKRLGVPAETMATDILLAWAEDAADLAQAERIMDESDPAKRIPWEQVKQELDL